jgi:hypothetical protein
MRSTLLGRLFLASACRNVAQARHCADVHHGANSRIPAGKTRTRFFTGRQFGTDAADRSRFARGWAERPRRYGGGIRRTLRSRDRRVVLACKRSLRAVGKMPPEARSAYALVEDTQFAMATLSSAES